MVRSPGEAESLAGASVGVVGVAVELCGIRLARLEARQFGTCTIRHNVLRLLYTPVQQCNAEDSITLYRLQFRLNSHSNEN